jgi:hypothetical protein
MPLEILLVPILNAICKPCWCNLFAMPGVAIYTENVVISTVGTGIVFKCERLEYPMECSIQYHYISLPLHIQPVLRNIVILDRNRQESDHSKAVH